MKAKDTVMSDEVIEELVDGFWQQPEERRLDPSAHKGLLKTQAEISFKAGQKEGRKEMFLAGDSNGYLRGIREVVEWVGKHATESIAVKDSDTSQEMNIRAISENEWQDELKEWGLK